MINICIFGGWGRVFEMFDLRHKLLVKPAPTNPVFGDILKSKICKYTAGF